MSIFITFQPADGIAKLADEYEKYAPSGASTYHVRGLAHSIDDGAIFGVVLGTEADFQTWFSSNGGAGTLVDDLDAYFTEGWGTLWQLLGNTPSDVNWGLITKALPRANPYEAYTNMLSQLKEARYLEIDRKTRQMIGAGFEYPADSDNIFSLSSHAQHKWANGFIGSKEGLLSYPIVATTMDESATVSLTDHTDVTAFYTAMLEAARAPIDSGRVLKYQVRDVVVTTEDDIIDIVDDR